MLQTLEGIGQAAQDALQAVQDRGELGAWRSAYLGRRGTITEAVKAVGTLPTEERPAYGRRANELKRALEAAYEEKAVELEKRLPGGVPAADQVDVSLPGRPPRPGRLHPATRTLRRSIAYSPRWGSRSTTAGMSKLTISTSPG